MYIIIVVKCIVLVTAATILQEKFEDFEETPQGVLDTLHELRQQLATISDENKKKEEAFVSAKEKIRGKDEELLNLRDQLNSTQESLRGSFTVFITGYDNCYCFHSVMRDVVVEFTGERAYYDATPHQLSEVVKTLYRGQYCSREDHISDP